MGVSALGYIGLEVPDLRAWRSYATGFLGLMDASPSDGELRLRAGWGGRTIDETWTVVRHKAPSIWGHRPAPDLRHGSAQP